MKLKDIVLETMITYLIKLCKEELNLSEIPPIELISEPTIPGTTSFGVYTGDSIQVVILNRHPVDVARTLAHELTHWKQGQTGMHMDGNTGSQVENQANAMAGIILRKFGKKYPEFFFNTLPD
jgi:Zn-dependent peptidase ImmA (M78 family)